MRPTKKPSRRDLLIIIGELQSLIGHAAAAAGNDRDENRYAKTRAFHNAAQKLCIVARGLDPPIASRGPWAVYTEYLVEREPRADGMSQSPPSYEELIKFEPIWAAHYNELGKSYPRTHPRCYCLPCWNYRYWILSGRVQPIDNRLGT